MNDAERITETTDLHRLCHRALNVLRRMDAETRSDQVDAVGVDEEEYQELVADLAAVVRGEREPVRGSSCMEE